LNRAAAVFAVELIEGTVVQMPPQKNFDAIGFGSFGEPGA
jgi:hypothetical protein